MADKPTPNNENPSILDAILMDGRMARDDSQHEHAISMLESLLTVLDISESSQSAHSVPFLQQHIQTLDEIINSQLNEIMHHPDFLELEGSWRGFYYLVRNTETSPLLKLRVLNVTKSELLKDFERAIDFDRSLLFQKVYEEEYGTFGGSPYSCLVGDYYFTRHPQDLRLLDHLSHIGAAAHAPFITSAHPKLFDLSSFTELANPRELSKIFESTEMFKWRSFRDSEDSRYVVLTLPRVLMRLPYGEDDLFVDGFYFKEDVDGTEHDKYCWGNAAYMLAQRITNAFSIYGWTAAIRGVEGGGVVEDLPVHDFKTTDGDIAIKCPTEIAITDRREKELSDLGFTCICHCKGTDYAVFFGGQSAQKPKKYNEDAATANALLSTRIPYILNVSRFAHYIKSMMRDKIGSFSSRADVQLYLNSWIAQYVLLTDIAPQEVKARYPLRGAKIEVYNIPGRPDKYRAVIYLRPHFQLEELVASLRIVADLPRTVR